MLPRLGLVWVVRDPEGALSEVHLPGLMGETERVEGTDPLGRDLFHALRCYESGDPSPLLQVPLVAAKTSFARDVRRAMRDIPAGQVRTYGQLARAIGKPGAARAIGQACGANPLPLVVPCHRVVAAGGIGGFALGLEAKRALLVLEGINVAMFTGFR